MKLRNIILIVLIVVATNLLTFFGVSSMQQEVSKPEQDQVVTGDLNIIQEIVNILEVSHMEEVDREELLEGAYRGMLEKLNDPEAGYLNPDHYENLRIQTEATYGGIGIEIFMEDDYVTIISPISGTPGEKAGLSAGDRIVSVDGINVVGEDLNFAVSLMRGEPETEVILEIERPGVDEVLEFEITREQIELESVEFEMLENNTGYIKLSSFSDSSGREFQEALDELTQDGMEGLIIDLRNNPGGLLDAAIEIADKLVPEGPITHVSDGSGTIKTYESKTEGLDIPMVALVNGTSVSASEVLAGALQDTDTAILVGKQTFGKASVQNIRELSDGGALRHTVAHYQTPSGKTIHEEGLTPDIEIDPPYVVELARKPISTSLALGDEGEEVETLQMILEAFGYYEQAISGYFDQATEEALEKFQEDRNIEVSGEMNEMVVRLFHREIEELKKEQDHKLEKALDILKQ